MTSELHQAPIEATRIIEPQPRQPKLSWREQRELRRRRRVWFEEILGWILVPAIIIGCYWLLNVGLAAMGSSPEALMDGFKTIRDAF
ncbi:hypothetical protein [Microvirga guangxiensis]|uniref:Uncharacterized protein n=1 Tax=Microvirga guangxiensis TaxID=549386 RepID=A0A1G5L660_9HYPH|nr:hypothetical protein [Microvirga guangxiensis]SCZ07679.1 hypothetical protein SAMN02927923_03897 [Microvirga guangxiensis]